MSKAPKKKKSRKQSEMAFRIVLSVLLGLIVVVMSIIVIYALKLGMNVPAVSEGTVVSTEPSQSDSQEQESSTQESSEEPTEESTEEPTQPKDPELEKAEALLATMSLEEKVYQMIFATPDSLEGIPGASTADEHTQQSLEQHPVGGLVYFSRNIRSADQITELTTQTQTYSKIPLFIGVDEEGGNVARLAGIVTEYYSPMGQYGAEEDYARVSEIGTEMAADLLSAGFNLDFAPVGDVISNDGNSEIGSRSFGSDPILVAQMARTMIEALQEGGVCACIKHFPGMGSTSSDSHYGRSNSERTLQELRETDMVPFESAVEAGVGMVMVSHMTLSNVTGETPCDLSYEIVTGLLREELGYDGVVITDSHEMASITDYYGCGEAAVLAIQAGCDVVLMPVDLAAAAEGIIQAVEDGTLTEERINESVLRLLLLKYELGIIS